MPRHWNNTKKTGFLTWDNNIKAYRFKSENLYSETKVFAQLLKTAIPTSHREWQPTTMTWLLSIEGDQLAAFKMLCEHYFDKFTFVDKEKVEKEWGNYNANSGAIAPIDTKKELETFFSLLQEANITLARDEKDCKTIRKAYQRAAHTFHPDIPNSKFRDGAKMAELNSSYQALQGYWGFPKRAVEQIQESGVVTYG